MDSNKILKSDYLDILFDGRNKNYGGYELRKNYPKRLRNAFAGLLLITSLGIAWPVIAGFGHDEIVRRDTTGCIYKLVDPPPPTEKPKIIPPEPKLTIPTKPTFKLAPPVIEKDAAVQEAEKPNLPPKDESIAIGMQDLKGDATGIDPGLQKKARTENGVATITPPIFTIVEQMPKSPYDWQAQLSSNIRYPDDARQSGIEGRSIVRFVVNEDGSISGVEIVKSSGSRSLDIEAMRVVAGMPKWIPGKQQGKAVKVYFILPIAFMIGD